MVSVEYVMQELDYCPDTGLFRWRKTDRMKRAGHVAGSKNSNGYVSIKMLGKSYKAHRLAWLVSHGSWPDGQIDHINRVRDDNRIGNLRVVSNMENATNRGLNRNSTSGITGVTWHAQCGKWQAAIGRNGVHKYLGIFNTKEEAAEAYSRERELRAVVNACLAMGDR
jgi:HNH endonuclease/AP2 domain